MKIKKRIKRTGALFMAILVLASLAACGEKEQEMQIIEDEEEEPEYLSFFSATPMGESDIGKYWSERFAKEYNEEIYINYDGASYYSEEGLSYRELLEKRLESSEPDDLYIINAEDVIEFEKRGYWKDLSDMDFVDNLSEAALYQSTYNDKVFSVPLSFTGFGFYWNVDMLEEHGLDIPENLGEFLNVCETLKAEGILPYGANKGYALTVPAMCKGMAALYGSDRKEQLIEELNSAETAISTYMREGYEFLSMMIEKGYLDAEQAMNTVPGEEMDMLVNGQCAFICAGLGPATVQSSKDNGIVMELTGLPVLEGGCIAVYGADSRLCVNPNSKCLSTALKFIETVGTPEALKKSAELDRTMSSAKDSQDKMEGEREQSIRALLRQPGQIPNQDFTLHFNMWENIRDVGREICGGMSVDEACAMLDERQRTELEEYASK